MSEAPEKSRDRKHSGSATRERHRVHLPPEIRGRDELGPTEHSGDKGHRVCPGDKCGDRATTGAFSWSCKLHARMRASCQLAGDRHLGLAGIRQTVGREDIYKDR